MSNNTIKAKNLRSVSNPMGVSGSGKPTAATAADDSGPSTSTGSTTVHGANALLLLILGL